MHAMTRRHRVRYEMLLRVRDFARTHQRLFPESSSTIQSTLAAVSRAVDQIERHETARLIAGADTRRDQVARREVMLDRMRSMARTSRRVVGESGAPLRLQVPSRVADAIVVDAARRFVSAVETHEEQFLELGLAPECLSELRSALVAFEASLSDPRVGRAGVAAAKAAIAAALTSGLDAARALDIIVRNRAGGDAAVLAAWERDLRLVEGIRRRAGGAELAIPSSASQRGRRARRDRPADSR
jgi:hypothetical protein